MTRTLREAVAKIFRFPTEFCADTRPYWVLFAGFAISISLLFFTLYARQPERYRGIWRFFIIEPSVPITPDIQLVAYAPPAADLNAAPAVVAMPPQNQMVLAPNLAVPTARCLGMTLKDVKGRPKASRAGAAPRFGVLVAAVPKTSPLYQAGLRMGDLIASLNRMPTPTVLDFQQALSGLNASQGILLDVFRNDKPCYITLDAQNIIGLLGANDE